MLDRIDNILRNQCKIQPDELIILGFSGGPDSLCLLHIMHQLGYSIVAMYVNHKLRLEADHEVEVVRQYTDTLGIKFVSIEAGVLEFSDEHALPVEEAARTLRYRLLFEQADHHSAKAVVVAHNADDQVETILMHLLRGSGLSGLRGMEFRIVPNPWSANVPLLRPFLSTWRVDIQKYIEEHHLDPISDSTNFDVSFFRNRIRHELLPILAGYNPSIREVFLRMGQIIKDDYFIIQQLTEEAWESNFISHENGRIVFNLDGYRDFPIAIQRQLLRKAISHHLPGLRDVGFDCIERGLMMLADEKPRSQVDLIAGIRLLKAGRQFWLTDWLASASTGDYPAIQPGEQLQLTVPTTLSMENNWQLVVSRVADLEQAMVRAHTETDPFQACLDLDALQIPLIVRARIPGDRIRPLGLNGHSTKVSDVMINLKLPEMARDGWPLICSGEEIVWMPGYRVSDPASIKPETISAIRLRLFQLDPA